MFIYAQPLTRRTFLQILGSLPLLPLTLNLHHQPTAQAAQLTAADGYGFGTYNEGAYPAQQQNIYLPLITKGE